MPSSYGTAKESSGPSHGSASSSSGGSSGSGTGNPFSLLEIHFNWGLAANLHTATNFYQAANSRVGYGYGPLTPYMSWSDNAPGDTREIVWVDLAKAWDDGVITIQADLSLYADWDQTWDDDPLTPPNPNPGSGAIQIVAYYLGLSQTIEPVAGSASGPATTYQADLYVYDDGAFHFEQNT